jgi:L-lactate dehydrogenase (cytochrome)
MDCVRSGIEMLIDICDTLRSAQLMDKIEIFMDGGVRRGSDIYKALAVGARAVGIGRPALFGLGAYGQEGVERALEILKEEFVMTMMLMGCPAVSDIRRDSVMTNTITHHVTTVPADYLAKSNYRPLTLTATSKL